MSRNYSETWNSIPKRKRFPKSGEGVMFLVCVLGYKKSKRMNVLSARAAARSIRLCSDRARSAVVKSTQVFLCLRRTTGRTSSLPGSTDCMASSSTVHRKTLKPNWTNLDPTIATVLHQQITLLRARYTRALGGIFRADYL